MPTQRHLLIVPGLLGPHGGFENYVAALVTVALDEQWAVTVVTARSAVGRTLVADHWLAAPPGRGVAVRSAEDDWRRTPTGRVTMAMARPLDRLRRRGGAGESRARGFIDAYWSGAGGRLLDAADLVLAVGKPKPFVTQAIGAAHRGGVPVIYSEAAQVTAAYAARPDLAGFAAVVDQVDLLLCFYDEQADDVRTRFGYQGPSRRVEQWADGVEADLLALPVATATAGAALVIGSLSRLSPEKGLDTLLRGFAAAAALDDRLRLRIAGTGPEGPALHRLADELGVTDRTTFEGYVEDRVAFYAGVDAFVVASIEEGGPITGAEAMAAGRAVVTTAAGAMGERVRPGVDGLRFDAGDHTALAGHLQALAASPDLVRDLGERARERYRQRNHSAVTVPRLVGAWNALAPARS